MYFFGFDLYFLDLFRKPFGVKGLFFTSTAYGTVTKGSFSCYEDPFLVVQGSKFFFLRWSG